MTTPTTTTTDLPARLAAMELRLPIDATNRPLGYPNPDDTLDIEIALDTDAGFLNLVLPVETARMWAGDLFGAVTVAHREATGDPHALSDLDLAAMPDPHGYQPKMTLALHADEHGPARMRFHVAVEIPGQILNDADLRAALVEALQARFPTSHIAMSNGQRVAGTNPASPAGRPRKRM